MICHNLMMVRNYYTWNAKAQFSIDFNATQLSEMEAQQIYRAISDILDGVNK